jgi:hypothetical protein
MFIKIKNIFYDWLRSEPAQELNLYSTITCPHCGFQQKEHMPVNACVIDYICLNCKKVLHAKEGDCCVFCSYGDEICPPRQMKNRTIE